MNLPKRVFEVSQKYISEFHRSFPKTLEGLYIHGSIALGAYDELSSDIDFITVTNRKFGPGDIERLSELHNKLSKKPEWDGVYTTLDDFKRVNRDNNVEEEFLYYNDGEVKHGVYFNFNPITWTILNQTGITVLGPNLSSLGIQVSSEKLQSYVLENMNTYWANRVKMVMNSIETMESFSQEEIDKEIEWTVLGLLRQFYTIRENGIISKHGSGEYGLRHLPKEWHGIVREAMNIRQGSSERIFSSKEETVSSMLGLCNYISLNCNNK